jgi:hypothetical protein
MDFKKHLETAWNLMLEHIVPLILMTLVMFVLSFITLGILAPVLMAGYVNAIVMMVRNGREPVINDLFSQMGLFIPLLVFSVVVAIAVAVGFTLLVLPGLAVIIAVTFGCLYVLPLMTDEKMGLVDALKTSWQMAMQDKVADHVVVVILFVGLTAIGSSVFIGTLFTQPFATIFVISVYLERKTATGQRSATPPTPPGDPDGE